MFFFCNHLIRKPQHITNISNSIESSGTFFSPESKRSDVCWSYCVVSQLSVWEKETIIGAETVTSAFTLWSISCCELSANSYVELETCTSKPSTTITNKQPKKKKKEYRHWKHNQMSSFILLNERSRLIKRNYARNKAFN